MDTLASSKAYLLLVPLIGPDFQELAILQAVASLMSSSSAQTYRSASFLSQRYLVDPVAQPYHSAAVLLNYTTFQALIQKHLSEEFNCDEGL